MPDTSANQYARTTEASIVAAGIAKERAEHEAGLRYNTLPDHLRRRQIRIDKMAAMLYVSNTNASESYMVNDLRDAARSVERAIALAAAVDNALGIAP